MAASDTPVVTNELLSAQGVPDGFPIGGTVPDAAPVARADRIIALDAVRGVAVLGILLMNIVAMGMYGAAYDDPTVIGGATGANLWTWIVMHVVAEGKMRCLFSMIFGASVLLLTSRLESKRNSADIYYRRTLWLLVFGVVHAFLLWEGDILYPYALCGLALYPFRNRSAKSLLIIGAVILAINSAIYVFMGFDERDTLKNGRAAEQAELQGKKLTEEQRAAKSEYDRWQRFYRPTTEQLQKDAKNWRGDPISVIKARAEIVSFFHNMPYYGPFNLDIWCMMFIGMGLFKLGALSGRRSFRFYAWLVIIAYGIGLPLNSYTAWVIVKNNFDPIIHSFANAPYDAGRLSVALGHLGAVMLCVKSGLFRWCLGSLTAIGQMAFSNYLFQSVVTAFIFTGYGFKLYDRLERYQLYYVVAGIWAVQMIASPVWLKYFRFGPLEWCWRSLTYWKRQPMQLETSLQRI
jgi:uncharacterized protein